ISEKATAAVSPRDAYAFAHEVGNTRPPLFRSRATGKGTEIAVEAIRCDKYPCRISWNRRLGYGNAFAKHFPFITCHVNDQWSSGQRLSEEPLQIADDRSWYSRRSDLSWGVNLTGD